MSGPTHKLYIDESGTKEYSPDGTYSVGTGPTRYFVFAGILLKPSVAGDARTALRGLKQGCFGDPSVEIKANWLKRPTERKKRYLEPFGISDSDLDAFVNKTYRLLKDLDAAFVASVVDKAEVQKRYAWPPWYAPAIAYECLAQRVQKEMERVGGTVSVTIDDMSGATPSGNQYKDNLTRHHKKLKSIGSRLIKGPPMGELADVGFSDSASDDRLQLADLVAYSTYRQFVDHAAEWDAGGGSLPTYKYFGVIADKFMKAPNGVMTGYGVVKFPRTSKTRWLIKK